MGWEEVTPLEHDQIRSQDKALNQPHPHPLDGNQGRFLSIDDPDLLLDTWKTAEDGKGTILRFIDLGGQSRAVTINVPVISIEKVTATNAVERDQKPIAPEGAHNFKISVQPHQIITVRLITK